MDSLLISADPDDLARERQKAKILKRSQWWKGRLGQGKCHYCGRRFSPRELTMDHMIPLIRGGETSRRNCVPSCVECNRQKQNLPPGEWKGRLEQLREMTGEDSSSGQACVPSPKPPRQHGEAEAGKMEVAKYSGSTQPEPGHAKRERRPREEEGGGSGESSGGSA
ncbi:MAG: HNH endonuclease [Magnetococcales bacterium]|nr:HNH endonuclease [Magnetococcales bacterium]MBF0155844.1 HNH endonuclease [Magnetococcales bacterium]